MLRNSTEIGFINDPLENSPHMLEKHEGAYEVGSVALCHCSAMVRILCVQEFLKEKGVPYCHVNILILGDKLAELFAYLIKSVLDCVEI